MELAVQDAGGGKHLTVSDQVFNAAYNEALIHQVVTAYLAGGRAGTKAQKSRADVRGGGAKPWKQKGTGRARAGSSRSPLWRKGGVTFAAVPRDHSQKVNRKMYKGALRSMLSELLRQGRLKVVASLDVETHKTKALVERLGALGLSGALLVAERADRNLFLAARNLPRVSVVSAERLDPVSLIGHETAVFTPGALQQLEARLA
ncbi:MAG: 50S ribosomal protein L4 [Gammaproteobacteria bacterium]